MFINISARIDACQGRYCQFVLERLWRMKEAILVFSIAGMAVLLAPAALWVRAVGFAAATVVYWRYVWKYKGVREETAAALERERERQRRADDDE
jgi:membrane protein implicated in regulation of membrane protease activity